MNNVKNLTKNLLKINFLLKSSINKSTINTPLFKYSKKNFSQLKYKFNNGTFKLPHFSKKAKGGEDALVNHEGLICVSDGVGGWTEYGVDPAKYSNELCDNIKRVFLKKGHTLYHRPEDLFVEACNETHSKGSATCCFCILDLEKNYLHTLNLGDSGYMILRKREEQDNESLNKPKNEALDKILNKNENRENKEESCVEIVFRSEEQTHGFNFPFQVGTDGDNPTSAFVNAHEIKLNDIVILGTDGLWDNLFDSQIIQILNPFLKISAELQDVSLIAEIIGLNAEKFSLNQSYKSPFSVRSQGLYRGGKPDDITIIVSQIKENK